MSKIEVLHIFADDITPEESWRLIQWCHDKGANEFSLDLAGTSQDALIRTSQLFDLKFSQSRKEAAARRVLTSQDGTNRVRPVELWALNRDSIQQLRELLPAGIFTYEIADALFEDLYVYRDDELMLGIVTHEQEGVLRVSTQERKELDDLDIKYRLKGKWVGY